MTTAPAHALNTRELTGHKLRYGEPLNVCRLESRLGDLAFSYVAGEPCRHVIEEDLDRKILRNT